MRNCIICGDQGFVYKSLNGMKISLCFLHQSHAEGARMETPLLTIA